MTNKRSIIKILEVSCVIFFSCYTIVPWIVYDQQKTTYIQKELIIELKKVSISEDVKEIYVNKAKRFGDRITTLELGRLQVQVEQNLSSNYISGIHLIKKSVEQFIRSVVA